jgi:hypothetical protein
VGSNGELSITTLFDGKDERQLSILRADGSTKAKFIELLNRNVFLQGSPVASGGAVNKNVLLNMLGAIGAGVGSNALSGGLFMATANIDTLMRISKGFSSAVINNGIITKHAPFIPAQNVIMPMAAPLIAYQALQTSIILKEFEVVNEKLENIQNAVAGLAYTIEIEAFGRLMSAAEITRDLEDEYVFTKRFTPGMLSRLALAEFESNALLNRYEFKYRCDMQQLKMPKPVCDELIQDTYGMILSSITCLQINELRLKAVLQEEPEYLERAQQRLNERISEYNALWHELQEVSREIKDEYIETTKKMNDSAFFVQALPWNWSDGRTRRDKANKILEVSTSFDETFSEPLKNIIECNKPKNEDMQETKLLYWQDEFGEHSFFTDDDFEKLLDDSGNKFLQPETL